MPTQRSHPAPPKYGLARFLCRLALLLGPVATVAVAAGADSGLGDIFAPFGNKFGEVQSLAGSPLLDLHNAFFDSTVGGNGQACVTCHQPDQGLTIQVD